MLTCADSDAALRALLRALPGGPRHRGHRRRPRGRVPRAHRRRRRHEPDDGGRWRHDRDDLPALRDAADASATALLHLLPGLPGDAVPGRSRAQRHETSSAARGLRARSTTWSAWSSSARWSRSSACGARIAAERARRLEPPAAAHPAVGPRLLRAPRWSPATLIALPSASRARRSPGSASGVRLPAGRWIEMPALILVGAGPVRGAGHRHRPPADHRVASGRRSAAVTSLLRLPRRRLVPDRREAACCAASADAMPSYWLTQAGHFGIGRRRPGAVKGWLVVAVWSVAIGRRRGLGVPPGHRAGLTGRRRARGPDRDTARAGWRACPERHAGAARRDWRQRWLFPAVWLVYLRQTVGGIADQPRRRRCGRRLRRAPGVRRALPASPLPAGSPATGGRGWPGRPAGRAHAHRAARSPARTRFVHVRLHRGAGHGRSRGRTGPLVVVAAMTLVAAVLPAAGAVLAHRAATGSMLRRSPLASLAMFGFFTILIRRNRELARPRGRGARLAAENERARIARDLHDLLGHSLTAITVKSALARRVWPSATRRGRRAEIGEVEDSPRRALADVRAAVAGYRDVTLRGELATRPGRAARPPASTPRCPARVDAVPARAARAVRLGGARGRHQRRAPLPARTRCTIASGPTWLEIVDDGRRPAPAADRQRAAGLRERVAAAAAAVTAGACDGGLAPARRGAAGSTARRAVAGRARGAASAGGWP